MAGCVLAAFLACLVSQDKKMYNVKLIDARHADMVIIKMFTSSTLSVQGTP